MKSGSYWKQAQQLIERHIVVKTLMNRMTICLLVKLRIFSQTVKKVETSAGVILYRNPAILIPQNELNDKTYSDVSVKSGS